MNNKVGYLGIFYGLAQQNRLSELKRLPFLVVTIGTMGTGLIPRLQTPESRSEAVWM